MLQLINNLHIHEVNHDPLMIPHQTGLQAYDTLYPAFPPVAILMRISVMLYLIVPRYPI